LIQNKVRIQLVDDDIIDCIFEEESNDTWDNVGDYLVTVVKVIFGIVCPCVKLLDGTWIGIAREHIKTVSILEFVQEVPKDEALA
jgi:hypothetical protein